MRTFSRGHVDTLKLALDIIDELRVTELTRADVDAEHEIWLHQPLIDPQGHLLERGFYHPVTNFDNLT